MVNWHLEAQKMRRDEESDHVPSFSSQIAGTQEDCFKLTDQGVYVLKHIESHKVRC